MKAYAACCLADTLRICAPDAPYTSEQLRVGLNSLGGTDKQDIFQFFCVQLTTNLKLPAQTARPLQPTRTKSNGETQSQSQLPTQSQRVTEIPFYTEYCYLLESLASIKSVVLACDVPGGDEIVTNFFEGFLQLVRSAIYDSGIMASADDQSGYEQERHSQSDRDPRLSGRRVW